jgi:hypothetical protein
VLVHVVVPELGEVAADGHFRAPYQCSPGKNTHRRLALVADLHIGGLSGPQFHPRDDTVTYQRSVDRNSVDVD